MEQGFCILDLIFDRDGKPVDYRFLAANPAFKDQSGLSYPVGKTIKELVPNIEEKWVERYGHIALSGESMQFIEGSEALGRWFEVSAYRLGDEDSRKVALIFTDITMRKKQESELWQLKDQLSNIVDNAGSGLMLFDSKGHVLQANHLAAMYQGYQSREELLNISMIQNSRRFYEKFDVLDENGEPFNPDDSPVKRAFFGEENPQVTIIQIDRTTGKKRWFLARSRRIEVTPDDIQILFIINDISLQKKHQQVEASLLATENRFRHMADNISQLAWMTDEKGSIFWYNERWFSYTGTTLDEMKGWGWTKVHHPDHVNRVVKKINRCFAEGRNWEDTFPLRSRNGEYRWFLSRAVVIRNVRGEITNWFGTNTDITDQLQASEKLSYQKGLLEAQHKTSPMGILVVDPDQRILMYNQRFEEIHRLDGTVDLVGKHESLLRELTRRLFKDRSRPESTLEKIYSTRAQSHDKMYFKDGRIIEWFGAPVLGEKGEYFGYAFSYIDVTEQENLLRQKDEFLAVASHELKTPVTSILAYTQLLQRQFENSDDLLTYQMLTKINQQINRLTVLINDLLDATKIEQGKLSLRKEEFDFNEMVQEMVEEVQRISSSHKISIRSEENRSVFADRDRLGQVVINFLTNAIKYSPQADRVDVAIEYMPDKVRLSVTDYGMGLSEKDAQMVFERFFRVEGKDRETFSGLGLGLFISSEIVQRHGGKIGVDSTFGEGSCFYFLLPLG
ncbi:hypothetical protein CRP01_07655 [Flavilitoribacter nigricans DSM 23189 = NBRC 102662]|uniref:histidine kinase n=2 Tax=Flavilitoribacter TaxID=2762562 RepID=A0A2D0NFA8_FLAN2|nr:hypothetical protein CRP01_07655 [Flavilitoribacter nigricans DSM 23189 = NBRC 102662]